MSQAEGRLVGGRYHLIEPIGRGGMGVVWRAHDQLLDRAVAVKEVRYDSAMGDELSDLNRRTMREARAAGRLTHPNVVVVHDVIEEDGRPWIIMQLVDSRSLGQVIREDGPLSPERTTEIGLQVLDALRAAHRQGVLHRDVKPENVLITDDGRVVLTDFGIARLEADSTMTRTGLVGTPAFIAPERLRGGPALRESDLWSLGATLYAAVEGKPPHDRGMAMATMHAVLNDAPAPAVRAGRLGPVLERLLAKEPADRPGYDETVRLLRQASAAPSPTLPEVTPAAAAGGTAAGGKAAPPRSKTPGTSSARPDGAAQGPSRPGGKPPAPVDKEPASADVPGSTGGANAAADEDAAAPGEITSPIPAIRDHRPAAGPRTGVATGARAEEAPGAPSSESAHPVPETGAQAAPASDARPAKPAPPQAEAVKDGAAAALGEAAGAVRDRTAASPAEGLDKAGAVRDRAAASSATGRDEAEAGREWAAAASAGGRDNAIGVPTQRSATWHGDSRTGPVDRRPSGPLKAALVIVPALLVIAGVAGFIGLRQAERTSTEPSTAATGHKASPPATATSSEAATPTASASASGEPSASSSPEPSPTPTTSQPADVPDGWHRYKDKTGFSVALPEGWNVSKRQNAAVWFRGPGTSGFLLIDQTSTPQKDAKKDWQSQEKTRRYTFANYKRVKIESVDYWDEAADWEFTFGSGSGRTHVVNRGFVTSKHHGYAIYWSTPDSRWDKDYHFFETFTATFKPAN